jgi:hypothetical protein
MRIDPRPQRPAGPHDGPARPPNPCGGRALSTLSSRRPRRVGLALSAASLVAMAACSSGNGLDLARVRGRVTYKGQPIKNGTVFFMPDESKGTVGPAAVGSITSDGSYIMSTESAGDGVIVGAHKVGITGVEEGPTTEAQAPEPDKDPAGYMKAKAKAAAATRNAARPEEFFTDRGGKKFRFVIPQKLSNPQESGIIAKVERGSNTINFDIDESGKVVINP